MNKWLNIGVLGGACWPTKEQTIKFHGHDLILKPATKDTEQSIHINLKGISDIDAMTLVNRFLSILSWCDDQGMVNDGGWSGTPVPIAVPKKSRIVGSSIAFPFNRDIEKASKAKLSLALYREALSINSIPFAFLSYFKILNVFWKDKYVNGKNELVEGIRNILPILKDDLAKRRLDEINKTRNDVPKYLYESGRCAIAHAHTNPVVDPDDSIDIRRLSQDIWIVKALSEYLIENELKVARSIMAGSGLEI